MLEANGAISTTREPFSLMANLANQKIEKEQIPPQIYFFIFFFWLKKKRFDEREEVKDDERNATTPAANKRHRSQF